ncbi:MAG: GrpB family protein, partial [Anaerolineae bacterium]
MIIIINGPLGVGKTEVAWKLIENFEKAVMLDGDYLGAVYPFDLHAAERVEYLYQTIAHNMEWHVAHGYHDFVVNYVFEQPASLASLRTRLLTYDDVTYAFRLTCEPNEHERRIRARSADPDQVRREIARGHELSEIQQRNAALGDLGYVIDTTGRSVDEVADAIWRNITEEVAIVPYDANWPNLFEQEQQLIQAALGDRILAIHHIGSTAVPGLAAKPVIDIMLVVRHLSDAAGCIAPLSALGYTFIDHPQNTERRFFRKGRPRTHHVHIVAQDNRELAEHLAFRDALRAN